MFEEKKKIICLMFKNTKTFKRIAISYTLVPYVLISLSVQSLKNGCLFIMNCFFKKKNKTDKWYEVVLKYLIVPILFGTVNPVKENSAKEYIFDIKYDERKSTKINRLDLCIYWTLVFIIDFIIMSCLFYLTQGIPKLHKAAFCIFVVVHQLGYGIRWKVLLEEEKTIIFLKSVYIFLGFIIIFFTFFPSANDRKIMNIQYLNAIAIFYLSLGLVTLFINIVLAMVVKSIKDFQKANLQKKWKLIFGDSFLISLSVLVLIIFIRILVFNLNFKSFNITIGYSTYLTLLLGSITVIGIFLNILSDMFFGKTLLYFVSNVSRNIFMLVGVRCFISSLMLIFLLGPYGIVYSSYKYLDILNIQYILIFAILFLLIATGFLLVYFYQVVYAVKNYSEKGGSEFNNMTKWFAFVLAENIEKSDLQLDSYAQDHLIERLIELKSLTDLEIVEIFNNNSEFENQDSENTVILAIFKYLNKDTVPVFLNLQRNRIKNLSYADISMKTELEKLQKKYGVYIADVVVENTMREKKKSIFSKIFLNFKIRENDI